MYNVELSMDEGLKINGTTIPGVTAVEVKMSAYGVSQMMCVFDGPIKLTTSTSNLVIAGRELEDDVIRRNLYDQLKAFYEFEE